MSKYDKMISDLRSLFDQHDDKIKFHTKEIERLSSYLDMVTKSVNGLQN